MSPNFIKTRCLALLLALSPVILESAEPVNITELFPAADSATTLNFHLTPPASGEAMGRVQNYSIRDYTGQVFGTGKVEAGDDGLISLGVTLPPGYYEVAFSSGGGLQATGVWASPSDATLSDGFLSIDTAISWLTKESDRPALINNLKHVVGAKGLSRERFTWNEVSPSSDRQEWDGRRKYEATRNLYANAGIQILEMFHDVPGWMKKPENKYPDDLIAVKNVWADIAVRWHSYWGALEAWNEPDHPSFSNNQPADQYVPLLKAVRYSMKESGVDTPLGGGVVSAMNPAYLQQAAGNGLLDECDFMSFHYYGDPLGLERVIAQYRAWMAMYDYEAKPLWITEIGLSRPGKIGERPSLSSEKETALTYAMQAVEAKACGIERFFPFVYIAYSEHHGSRHFGMLDHKGAPLRMLAASAQAGRMLSEMTYAGDLSAELFADAKRVRVFTRGEALPSDRNEALVVVYSGAVSSGRSMKLPFAVSKARGVDGRNIASDDNKTIISMDDGLAYLTVPVASIEGLLRKDTEAMRLHRILESPKTSLPAAAAIVLQPQIDPSATQAVSTRGYFLPDDCERLPIFVNVNNLGSETRTVRVRRGGSSETKEVTVKGGAFARIAFEAEIATLPRNQTNDAHLFTLEASSEDGSRIAPVSLTLIPSGKGVSIASYLKDHPYHFALTVSEAYRWDRNANGPVIFTQNPPAAWGFSVKFPPNVDRWAYPRFSVPQEVDQTRITGVLVRARCLKPATVRLLSWNDKNEMSMTIPPIFPADGEWHISHIPLDSYQGFYDGVAGTARVAKLSIGFNSDTDENSLEISDLYFIGQ